MTETVKCFPRVTRVFDTVKPPRSGPSETVLRLRSLPEGCSLQAKILLQLIRTYKFDN